LLQGHDAAVLEQRLVAVGGRLTHRLPIVRGIGGEIRFDALSQLQNDPAIERVIEDINPPETPEPRTCALLGSIELARSEDEATWTLFNVADTPLAIREVAMSWPAAWGPVTTLTLNGRDILANGPVVSPLTLGDADDGKVASLYDIAPATHTTLQFTFANHPVSLIQSELSLRASTSSCIAELPPAYATPNDFFYSRVVGASELHARDIRGQGVTIAVLDSGLESHPDLSQTPAGTDKIPIFYDAMADRTINKPIYMTDESGHGTHIISTIAHRRQASQTESPNHTSYKGVAPDARIIPVKVFPKEGSGDFLDIIRGIQWVVDHRITYNISILNLSLAAQPRFFYWDDPINQAVLKAWQAGITVVTAAGNEGADWSTVGSPGNNPYVITVGALTDSWTPLDRTDDYIPDFSSRGPTPASHIKPDIVAPGGHIAGIVPLNSTMARDNPHFLLQNGYFVSTGSSQAAAVVSGVAALLLQLDPGLTNDDIKCMLTSSAEPAINRDGRLAYSPFVQGSGAVSAPRAVIFGERGCGNTGMTINSAILGEERLTGAATSLPSGEPDLPGLQDMLATESAAQGSSATRVWGIKAHVERLLKDADEAELSSPLQAHWLDLYLRESDVLRTLQNN
jgi:subtilisin family serine protease